MARQSSRRRVAFATCRTLPEVTADDALAATACRQHGFDVVGVAWEDEGSRWENFDAIVVRSVWTYHLQTARFLSWLDRLAGSGARVFNPVELMRWNSDKTYLLELERRGVPVIPTVRLDDPDSLDPGAIEMALGTVDIVVKPAVGASAEGVHRGRLDRAVDVGRLAEALRERPLLVQTYVPEVATQGEWSLIHFAGAFSHAVLKSPTRGEFRVQEALGGTIQLKEPPEALRRLCTEILSVLDFDPLYARADLLESSGRPLLVELELIEPALFFAHAPGSARRFADALASALGV